MFLMIFVNDLAGAGKIVPDWMVHFSDRHRGGSGMTFVDLVVRAFLFIVGMSVPFALGGRMAKGEPILLYLVTDVRPVKLISRPLALAGQNVLLAYLISEMLPGLLDALHLGDGYGHLAATLPAAILRSALCGVLILFVSASLNRIGFRLRL